MHEMYRRAVGLPENDELPSVTRFRRLEPCRGVRDFRPYAAFFCKGVRKDRESSGNAGNACCLIGGYSKPLSRRSHTRLVATRYRKCRHSDPMLDSRDTPILVCAAVQRAVLEVVSMTSSELSGWTPRAGVDDELVPIPNNAPGLNCHRKRKIRRAGRLCLFTARRLNRHFRSFRLCVCRDAEGFERIEQRRRRHARGR